MTDLDAIFAQPAADALSILLGHDAAEAQAWWLGADLAGVKPSTVQDLLVARRTLCGTRCGRNEIEIGIAAVSAFLVPVASDLSEIDAIHDDLAQWLAPMLDEAKRTRVMARLNAANDILDDPETDLEDRMDCIDAIQATAFDVTFANAFCSVNVVKTIAGEDRIMIIAAACDDIESCVEIGNMPLPTDNGDGPSEFTLNPVAPAPMNA